LIGVNILGRIIVHKGRKSPNEHEGENKERKRSDCRPGKYEEVWITSKPYRKTPFWKIDKRDE